MHFLPRQKKEVCIEDLEAQWQGLTFDQVLLHHSSHNFNFTSSTLQLLIAKPTMTIALAQ